jgi:hypothetical protein
MGAVLDDAAPLDGDDPVSAANRRQPMGDDQDRAALRDLAHVLLDDPLAFVIERARCLVEDHDARIGHQRPRDRDALLLAAGQGAAALADEGVVAFGQFQDEIMGAGELCRRYDSFHGDGGIG